VAAGASFGSVAPASRRPIQQHSFGTGIPVRRRFGPLRPRGAARPFEPWIFTVFSCPAARFPIELAVIQLPLNGRGRRTAEYASRAPPDRRIACQNTGRGIAASLGTGCRSNRGGGNFNSVEVCENLAPIIQSIACRDHSTKITVKINKTGRGTAGPPQPIRRRDQSTRPAAWIVVWRPRPVSRNAGSME